MKVTDIKQQVKRAGRYSIFIDGDYSFSLSEGALLDSGLRLGLELSASEVKGFQALSGTDKRYQACLGLIARRPRSIWEIEDYLKRKGAEADEIRQLVNKLTNIGLLDDLDFARRWVESRRLLKSLSVKKLRLELRQKRVPDTIITEVLADDPTDEVEVLKQLIERKRTQSRYQDDLKLAQYLTRQGFSYDIVKSALRDQGEL